MEAPAATTPRVLHLSFVVGGDVLDPDGKKLGRVDDLIVRLGEDEYPPVTGLLATIAGRQVFVPADAIADDRARQGTAAARAGSTCGRSSAAPAEVLLKKDVLDRQLINVDGARLVRTNEIELARLDGWYRVVGVDTGLRGLVRRGCSRARSPARSARASSSTGRRVEPFTGPRADSAPARAAPEARAAPSGPARRPRRAGVAPRGRGDPRRGRRRPGARGGRVRGARAEPPAGVHRGAPRRRDRGRCSRAWSPTTRPTSSASCPRSAASEVVRLLPLVQRRRVRALLGYDPATAGGLMSPEFVCVYSQATQTRGARPDPQRRDLSPRRSPGSS